MKKIVKIFTLIICLAFLLTMTSCSTSKEGYEAVDITKAENLYTETVEITKDNKVVVNTKANDEEFKDVFVAYLDTATNIYYFEGTVLKEDLYGKSLTAVYLKNEFVPKGTSFVGFLEKADQIKLYTKGSSTTIEGKTAIFVAPEASTGVVSFPKVAKESHTFSGWYTNEECSFGNRVSTVNEATGVLYARFVTFGEGAIVTVVCVAIVFLMLALLCGITSLIKVVNKKEQKVEEKAQPVLVTEPKQVFTMNDIKDDDMMAAALVATIDYHNETKKDVRVVSIKEIK